MRNAEYDTPTSGDLAEGDEDGRRILEGLRAHLRESGAAVGAVEKSSREVGGPRLRRRLARLAAAMREANDITDGYVRAAEKWSSGFDAITRRDLVAASSMSDITPDTHVRMSTAKFLAIVGGIVMIASGAVAAWFGVGEGMRSLASSLAVHERDRDVHIDPDYQKDHGRPVGKWDLDAYKAETNRTLQEQGEKLDRILNLLAGQPTRRGPK